MTKREQYLSSLTDEELADLLNIIPCSKCPVGDDFCNTHDESCNGTILRWLKQEETEEKEMRELSLKKVKIGEHIIIDEVEYVAQEGACDNCELKDDAICKFATVCPIGGKLTKVKKEPQYRPYKDTDEMISDWKERFMVDEIADFCMPMIWVKDKPAFVTVGTRLIVEIFEHVVRLGNSTVHLQNLFDNYTYLDGSPCGKVEE